MKTKIQSTYTVGDIVKSNFTGHIGCVVGFNEEKEQIIVKIDGQQKQAHPSCFQIIPDMSIEELTSYYSDLIKKRTQKDPCHFNIIVREYFDKKESYIRIHYNNYKDNSEGATYYLAQCDYTISSDYPARGSEENLTIEQAARYMANFMYYAKRGFSMKEIWKMESA